jgi:acetylglutamate kinase
LRSIKQRRPRHEAGNATVKGGMQVKAQAILTALEGGVKAVHVVDGRAPHSVVVELFTDKGVGTVVRA